MSIFSGSLSYILLVGTILLGIEEFLRKRDDEFKDKRRMKGVFAGLILMGVLNLASLYHDNDEKERKEKKAEKDNAALQRNVAILQGKVDIATQAQNTAIQAQKDNTAQYLTKFGQLSDKVNELKTEVTTAELQRNWLAFRPNFRRRRRQWLRHRWRSWASIFSHIAQWRLPPSEATSCPCYFLLPISAFP